MRDDLRTCDSDLLRHIENMIYKTIDEYIRQHAEEITDEEDSNEYRRKASLSS